MSVFKTFGKLVTKKAPTILIVGAIVGVGTTVVLAFKASPKADEILKRKKEELDALPEDDKEGRRAVLKEFVKEELPVLAPVLISAGLTVVAIVSAHSIHARRQAALALAYNLSEQSFKEYKEKAKEALGPKKEQAIRDEINHDKVVNNPLDEKRVYETGHGNILWYDPYSGRYFRASVDFIQKVENCLNKKLILEMYASVNDFYELVGLDTAKLADLLGWNIDSGHVEIGHTVLDSPYDEPCYVLDYQVEPRYNYAELH
jgi:hypothetical protein